MAACGRFGKYGDFKRKANLRRNIGLQAHYAKDAPASRKSAALRRQKTEGGGKK